MISKLLEFLFGRENMFLKKQNAIPEKKQKVWKTIAILQDSICSETLAVKFQEV